MRRISLLLAFIILLLSCNSNNTSTREAVDSTSVRDSVAEEPPPPPPPFIPPLDSVSLKEIITNDKGFSSIIAPADYLRLQLLANEFTPEEIFLEFLHRSGGLKGDTVIPENYRWNYPPKRVRIMLEKLSNKGIFEMPDEKMFFIYGLQGKRVRYGPDNREEVVYDPLHLAAPNASRKDMSNAVSVAAVIPRSLLEQQPDGSYARLDIMPGRAGRKLCPSELFAGQKAMANCTAFLLNDSTLITAGHCINAANVDDFYFVFDYIADDQGQPREYYPASHVFTARSILPYYDPFDEAHPCVVKRDLCLISLNGKTDKNRLRAFNKTEPLMPNDTFYVIGCSAGLPLKLAGQAALMDNTAPNYFTISSDTYKGNSGSPVFNARTNAIEGYFIRGCEDYGFKPGNLTCFVSVECPFRSKCPAGEVVIRSSTLFQLIN